MKCRHCQSVLNLKLIDLGTAPPSNSYLSVDLLDTYEKYFPLRVLICEKCWLVQTEDYAKPEELFSADYAYFSSYSSSWLNHAQEYVTDVAKKFDLNQNSFVVEVAANDGYLLKYVKDLGIKCLGIEPTKSTATVARARGIPIVEEFFGLELAQRMVRDGQSADLIVANNVLAHVPNINDFVSGFACLLKPEGVATFEFPHLAKLIQYSQFDTIYHEHYSYLSLSAVHRIFESNGLRVFDVEELSTHGGSLRVYAQPLKSNRQVKATVLKMLEKEFSLGLLNAKTYTKFYDEVERIKFDLLSFLIEARRTNMGVCAYGAAAKGNTLLNYAGVKSDLIPYVVDKNLKKQGLYMPGSRIPILDEAKIYAHKPNFIVILPWNLRDEIVQQLGYVREWGGQFVTAVPRLEIF